MSERLGVLADDLTGAHASAARLVAGGQPATVVWELGALPAGRDALVVDMGSRDADLPPREVAACWARALADGGCGRFELRVDTTFNSATAEELDGVMEGANLDAPIVVALPAYPDGGRQTVRGRQLIEDAHEPARSVDVGTRIFPGQEPALIGTDLLERGPEAVCRRLSEKFEGGTHAVILDAMSDAHLAAGARVVARLRATGRIVVTVSPGAWLRYYRDVAEERFVLVVLASPTPANVAQLHALESTGDIVTRTPEQAIADPDAALHAGTAVVAVETVSLRSGGADAARAAAEAARTLLERAPKVGRECTGLVASGGHAAAVVTRALGGLGIEPLDEVAPLCARGRLRGGRWEGLTVVTKGGVLGDSGTLRDLIRAAASDAVSIRSATIASRGAPSRWQASPNRRRSMSSEQPIIALTMGDPAGIGPEIVLKALAAGDWRDRLRPVVVGDASVADQVVASAELELAVAPVARVADARWSEGVVPLLDARKLTGAVPYGKVDEECGAAAITYIEIACELALDGEVHGLVTGPINKEAIWAAGSPFPGHTEMLAHLFDVAEEDAVTMFLLGRMRIFFLTRHHSLREAIDLLSVDRAARFLQRVHDVIHEIGVSEPTLALAALNPHAGENGKMGTEERDILIPAVELARQKGIDAVGPVPADAVFHQALEGRYDGVIALYHDQGHVAAKTTDFFGTVACELGLPVIRTTVDHGTAFDIAGQWRADARGQAAAMLAAAELAPKVLEARTAMRAPSGR